MRRLLSFPHLLVMAWVFVLLWGERWVFHTRVESCHWSNWEKWPAGANPHHLIFVADPQIIDPKSYPGRPWPLNPLTVQITDNYLRRSYNQLQSQLHPDTVFFLGDLFDGGREWKTAHGDFRDPEWNHRPAGEKSHAKSWKKKYGEGFWLREYARFGDIFFDPWNDAGPDAGKGQRGRKLIASLPGNHDLGFGSEVKAPVRDRFEAYFGDVNRVDVIGNHTFVSVDTVSWSAASSDETAMADLRPIYMPTQMFLDDVQSTKRKAVEKELRFQRGQVEEVAFNHKIEDLEKADFKDMPTLDPGEGKAELPTVLLTHVPLYRPPGTPCGPLREHWPPAKPPKGQTEPVFPDHRNAITVAKGYQYQNVLGEADSAKLVKQVGNVIHAFSGDDHDYCELTHAANQGGVKEITVKSISMAMGVPTPAFLMVSMYNPVDADGKPLPGAPTTTLQTHLCLLPNQISTYMRYGLFAFVCIVILAIRASLVPLLKLQPFALDMPGPRENVSILPTYSKAKVDDYDRHRHTSGTGYSASHFLSGAPPNAAATVKSNGTRDRSSSLGFKPNGHQHHHHHKGDGASSGKPRSYGRAAGGRWGWGDGPKIQIGGVGDDDDDEDDGYAYDGGKSRGVGTWRAAKSRSRTTVAVVVREMWTTSWRVAWMALLFLAYLTWKG
ncbi:putative cell division control protein 1 protein [Phaeoacremonium minimum UCRPA7]|uniref:Putative cell division control protein 1 protein n=1 Tax=Phaeoacremonium minimum (strain UCR-PA7) TaxID=1286976 RepID=R8BN32_PHAM7|nr:putative cell division control protein 1 protein [Phaeoacremonium minimum UCRPA7]EOO00749.1 putative cell division control protein 1 protein [Phaeoacremonium minimum UCRPA7]